MSLRIKSVATRTFVFAVLMACAFTLFLALNATEAQAAFSFSSNTIGIGKVQSTNTVKTVDAPVTEKIAVPGASTAIPSETLAVPTERVVKEQVTEVPPAASADPASVFDEGSSDEQGDFASSAAASNGDWLYGKTTVYDDGTRDPNGITCAVPLSMGYLKGSYVRVSYNGTTVDVLINDVGGFAKYGIALDFTPGTCRALGFNPGDNPYVSYMFL